jgi:hypothetical protein
MKKESSIRNEEIFMIVGVTCWPEMKRFMKLVSLLQYVKNAKSIAETLSVIPDVNYENALETASFGLW